MVHSTAAGARSAGESVADGAAEVAHRSKVPALAAGAVVAGLTAGVAIGQKALPKRKVLGVPLPRKSRATALGKQLGKAAGELGKATGEMSELNSELRALRGAKSDPAAGGGGASPIEVVLSSLTRRRN